MKVKQLLGIIMLMLVMVLTACSGKPYEEYREAMERNEQVERGKMSVNVEVKSDFTQKGAQSAEAVKAMGAMQVDNQIAYEADKVQSLTHVKMGEVGYDMEYYGLDGENYLYMPLLGKYIHLEREAMLGQSPMTYELISEIQSQWVGIFKKHLDIENTLKGKGLILETEEGQIKATEYTVNLSKETLNQMKDELSQSILSWAASQGLEDEKAMEKAFKQIEVNELTYKGFVNKDGYVNRQEIEISYSFNGKETLFKGQRVKVIIEEWDFNAPQHLDEINIPTASAVTMGALEKQLVEKTKSQE